MSTRILNSERYLAGYLNTGDKFFIGLFQSDFQTIITGNPRWSITNVNAQFTPPIIGPATRANVNGKMVRKQPEEKHTKNVHIEYTTKNGTFVSYDRDFHCYVKVLDHHFRFKLSPVTNRHGQRIVISEELTFDGSPANNKRNTAIINVFLECFGEIEIFDANLEPALLPNRRYATPVLPSGLQTEDDIKSLVDLVSGRLADSGKTHAYQKRLHYLKNFQPDIRGIGPKGFFGYIVFGFVEQGVVLLESMYEGNATYVFNIEGHEKMLALDKQQAMKDPNVSRVLHNEHWEKNIAALLGRQKAA